MKITTSKTRAILRKHDMKIRAEALREGRMGLTRREFLRVVAKGMGAVGVMMVTPKIFARAINDPSGLSRERYVLIVKVKEQSEAGFKQAKSFSLGIVDYEGIGQRQIERVKDGLEMIKAVHDIDANIIGVSQPAKPRANMKQGRAKATNFFAIAVETGEIEKVAYKLRNSSWVEKVAIVPKGIKIVPNAVPNDEFVHNQYTIGTAETPLWQNLTSKVYEADDVLQEAIKRREIEDKEPTNVGIIDREFFINHEDLKDNIWLNEDEVPNNGIDDDNDGYIDNYACWQTDAIYPGACNIRDVDPEAPFKDNNHGTSVAGMAGARWNNTVGVTGTSSNLVQLVLSNMGDYSGELIPETWENPEISAFFEVIYLTDMGSRVINMSWQVTPRGIVDGEPISEEEKQFYKVSNDFLKTFSEDGVVFVASAGNHAIQGDGRDRLVVPAKLPSVIAVASSRYLLWDKDHGKVPAEFSLKGRQWKEISEAGVIEGGNRALFAPGAYMWTTNYQDEEEGYGYDYGTGNNTYKIMNGTSFAAPFVAGFLGAIIHVWPEIAQDEKAVEAFRNLVMGGSFVYKGIATELIDGMILPRWETYDYLWQMSRDLGDGNMALDLPGAQLFRADKLARAVESLVEKQHLPSPPRRDARFEVCEN